MTTTLGKGSLWQPDKRDTTDDYEKNSQESGFHHFSPHAKGPLESTHQNLYTPRGELLQVPPPLGVWKGNSAIGGLERADCEMLSFEIHHRTRA
jgi:hypothetical protein